MRLCRYVPMFGETSYRPSQDYTAVPLEEQMAAVGKAVAAGKVRAMGLSNETPWGLMHCGHLGESAPVISRLRMANLGWLFGCHMTSGACQALAT